MKLKIKNYEIVIALIIVANILIFIFFSKGLEGFIVDYTVEVQQTNGLN